MVRATPRTKPRLRNVPGEARELQRAEAETLRKGEIFIVIRHVELGIRIRLSTRWCKDEFALRCSMRAHTRGQNLMEHSSQWIRSMGKPKLSGGRAAAEIENGEAEAELTGAS
jgi:hypothetical protein